MNNSLRSRLASFRHAFRGMVTVVKEEPNARIHLVAALVVIALGYYYNVSSWEWTVLILCIAGVVSMEMINSSIENLADFVTTEKEPLIRKTKDLAAGAVLIVSLASTAIALLIFIPKIAP